MKFIVFRTRKGLMVTELYGGACLAMKKDPKVLEWWTVDARDEEDAKNHVRKKYDVNVLGEFLHEEGR